jgi:ferredoxin
VLQAAAAHLFGQRGRLRAALEFAGPALIRAFSGAGAGTAGLAPYLVSAAAAESRAFPGFVYDPAAGADWASRFRLDPNPQPEADWPLHPLNWEDAAYHRQGETVAFTVVDFLACDRRASSHFAVVARDAWNEQLVPLAAMVERPGAEDRVPVLFMADADGALCKVIADEAALSAARRCLRRWRSLQELGGIGNSHAARAVAAARAEWERTASPPPAPTAPAAEAAAAPAAVPAEPEPAGRDPSVAYIETARCSSCNECVQINDRMFGYDANKQAFIIDAKVGTYRQLVEAAESCQVSVIHPGKPLDPNEPGLEELLQRAEPFL